ncbi:YceD family protein [Pseudonocardia nantongensis]|uniref:YceD family protein n=1 Tax=Pseudonocardia nantongensis TaxID=1181885 RepID=UPI0039787DE0
MSTQRTEHTPRPDEHSPWVFSTRELVRRPGTQRTVTRTVPAPGGDEVIGLAGVIAVPDSSDVELDLSLESVTEGVYVSGTATARLEGECSRCLDPLSDEIEIRIGELFAYPDSVTEETTDADEIPRLVDDRFDLTQAVRDAVVTELPMAPLCREDCPGLCSGCGERWADLAPDHGHETLDPRWAALKERLPSAE